MSQGFSFESFAATIKVHRDTLYEWCKTHSQFSDAKKIGKDASLFWWEQLGRGLATGKLKGNVASWIFSMKNHHNWTDKNETTLSSNDQVKIEYHLNESKPS